MKLVKLLFGAAILLLSACGPKPNSIDVQQAYKLLTIKSQSILLNTVYSASIQGRQDIRIIPRVEGYLTQFSVKEGERVKEGQSLFVIDQVPYMAELQAAKANQSVCEANLATAKLNLDSRKALFDKKVVSEYDWVSARNAYNIAQAQYKQSQAQTKAAENNLSYTIVKSPSDGVVGRLNYRKGDYVGSTSTNGITVISDNSQMYVYFSMTERQIMQMYEKHGSSTEALQQMPHVKLLLATGTVYTQEGRVESISGVIDSSTGAIRMMAAFPNPKGILLSGGSGSVIIPYMSDNAIVIPQEATFEIQDKTYVYKVVKGKTKSAIVQVSKINNGKDYVVTDGLQEGDVIIAEGAGLVQENIKVMAKE